MEQSNRVTFTSSIEPKHKGDVIISKTGPSIEGPSKPHPPTSLMPLNIKEAQPVEDDLSLESDEDHKMYQVWVASCYTHCSIVTVTEYCGQFVKIEVSSYNIP